MRIAFGGIAVENSNFSPVPTTLADFHILTGDALRQAERYSFLDELPAEFAPTLFAHTMPGGPLATDAYEVLKRDLLAHLQAAGPVDGVYLDLHGAMYVDGMEDAEADLATAVRAVVGPQAFIAASMDLHGNISQQYIDQIDLLTAYRTAPHRDMVETRQRACRRLIEAIQTGVRPQIALTPIPVLLSGEATRTDAEPGRTLWASLAAIEQLPSVIDASLFVGFAWVDEPRSHAAAVIVGTDSAIIQREADKLAAAYWAARHEFGFGTPVGTIAECIAWALAADEPCIFISDSGDNTTAGGVGDLPLVLARLLAHEVADAVVGGLADAAAVAACWAAGVGAQVTTTVGAKLSTQHGQPLPVLGRVLALVPDDGVKGRQAVLQVAQVQVILTERRGAFTTVADFTQAGVDPLAHKIIVVKLGYLFPELLQIASNAFMALSPGAADQHLERLPYKRIARPMFPLDRDFDWTSQ